MEGKSDFFLLLDPNLIDNTMYLGEIGILTEKGKKKGMKKKKHYVGLKGF